MSLKTLFGDITSPRKIQETVVNLYCDEIKNTLCPQSNDFWHYVGILIVPREIEPFLLNDLLKARFFKKFSPDNKLEQVNQDDIYFQKNNRVVHFNELGADTYYIAKRWYDYIKGFSMGRIYFNILGINASKLNPLQFGGGKFNIIYNRFFRSAAVYPLLKFFRNSLIKIENIFHERGDQETDDFFPWNAIYKINNEEKWPIECLNNKIRFLDKNHKVNNRGNFIQLIDSILGATRNCFDNSCTNEFKVKLTTDYSELIKRLVEYPDNPNSKYCKDYCKRMNLDFFPKKILDTHSEYYDLEKRMNMFHKREGELAFLNRHQKKLLQREWEAMRTKINICNHVGKTKFSLIFRAE